MAIGNAAQRDYTADMATDVAQNVITPVLPSVDEVIAALPPDLAAEDELGPRVRLGLLNAHVGASVDDLDEAIDALRARAAGDATANPFGARHRATTYAGLADAAERALAAGELDLATVLALQYE